MKNSDACRGAMVKVQNNQLLIQKLGSPIEVDGMIQGSIKTSEYSGNADLQVPIKGSKDEGVLFIVSEKHVNWQYKQLYVYLKSTDEEINLLTDKIPE